MGNFKINSPEENVVFVPTQAYMSLLRSLEELREKHGAILHVVGAPGTGKSTNIYHGVKELDMNIYKAKLPLQDKNISPKEVFKLTMDSMKYDLGVETNEALYRELKSFDAIIFADEFHDSHIIKEGNVGFSQWTAYKGWKSLSYYLYCFIEYIRHRKDFNDINIILQTAWRINIGGEKKDLFTDFGLISQIGKSVMKIPFKVVEINYTTQETIEIVENHLDSVDEKKVKRLIELYGCKPRIICEKLLKEDF